MTSNSNDEVVLAVWRAWFAEKREAEKVPEGYWPFVEERYERFGLWVEEEVNRIHKEAADNFDLDAELAKVKDEAPW